MLKSLGDINILIDIGANKGQFSVLFKYIYPKSSIFAFEPLESPSKLSKSYLTVKRMFGFISLQLDLRKRSGDERFEEKDYPLC